jgi:hypothetical protein
LQARLAISIATAGSIFSFDSSLSGINRSRLTVPTHVQRRPPQNYIILVWLEPAGLQFVQVFVDHVSLKCPWVCGILTG